MRQAFAASLLLTIAAALPAAGADAVFRCGDGHYSSSPCPGGVAVDAADARSAEQRRQAQEAARRDAALADRLAAERRDRERHATPARAASLGPAAKPASAPASAPKPRHGPHKRKPQPDDPRVSPPMRAPASAAAAR